MRYLPHTEQDIRRMLDIIGVKSLDELFREIPDALRLKRPLDIPGALSERELAGELKALSEKNEVSGFTSFIGAGIYNHYAPAMIDHILKRSEFYTAYTPYQPEVSQGTLQAIFEYQSLISLLLEVEVTNASLYDGATGTAEAVLMARRIQRRRPKVLMARNVHPEFRRVTETYMVNSSDDLVEVGYDKSGRVDPNELESGLDGETACLVVGHPNYFGVLEDLNMLADKVHEAGALLVVTFAEPLAFGVIAGPGRHGADIITGEGQSFLGAMNFGGPSLGILSTREKFVRQMPGRVCGMTEDVDGRRGFVLTLSTREQHIRREKATSNICTNQGLCALGAAVFLTLMGKQGLRKLAELNLSKAEYLKGRINGLENYGIAFDGPTFNEFVISCDGGNAADLRSFLYGRKILCGLDLKDDYPELDSHLLVNVTEMHDKADIDRLVEALEEA